MFEVNNLIVRLRDLNDRLKTDNPGEELLFNCPADSLRLWKSLEKGVCEYLSENGKEVSAGEIIYVLSAFLNWHLEKVLKEYYNKLE